MVEKLHECGQIGCNVGERIANLIEIALERHGERGERITVFGREAEEQGKRVFGEITTEDGNMSQMPAEIFERQTR